MYSKKREKKIKLKIKSFGLKIPSDYGSNNEIL